MAFFLHRKIMFSISIVLTILLAVSLQDYEASHEIFQVSIRTDCTDTFTTFFWCTVDFLRRSVLQPLTTDLAKKIFGTGTSDTSRLEYRVAALEYRVAALEYRMAALEDRMAALEDRMAALEDRMGKRMAALEYRMAALEDRVGKRMAALEVKIDLILSTLQIRKATDTAQISTA